MINHPSPIMQSYKDVSLEYYEKLLTSHGMSPLLWSTKT